MVLIDKVEFRYILPTEWDIVSIGYTGALLDGTPIGKHVTHATAVGSYVFTVNADVKALVVTISDLDNGEAELFVNGQHFYTFPSASGVIQKLTVVKAPIPQKKLIGTWIMTWYPHCCVHDTVDDWSTPGHSLVTPEMGSYNAEDPVYIEYALRKMEEAGIDFAFVDVGDVTDVYRIGQWLDVAERIGSKIKIAGWWGGAATRRDNGVIENVQAMKNAGYFDRPGYFKWDDQPVVSGYCDGADPSNNFNYWVTAKQQFPEIMFWINGWHPNYWNPIVEGYVDGAFVFNPSAPAKNAEESQVNYYDLCNQIGLKIHIFTATPGFDNTIWNEKLGWTLKKLDRRNGDTYRECWDAIKDLEPQPDVIMVLTWNDWWEIDGIEHISVSRSTTTDAFGDLYLRLTKQYGSIWKREAPSIPPIIPIIAIIVICVIIGGGVIVVSHPR